LVSSIDAGLDGHLHRYILGVAHFEYVIDRQHCRAATGGLEPFDGRLGQLVGRLTSLLARVSLYSKGHIKVTVKITITQLAHAVETVVSKIK